MSVVVVRLESTTPAFDVRLPLGLVLRALRAPVGRPRSALERVPLARPQQPGAAGTGIGAEGLVGCDHDQLRRVRGGVDQGTNDGVGVPSRGRHANGNGAKGLPPPLGSERSAIEDHRRAAPPRAAEGGHPAGDLPPWGGPPPPPPPRPPPLPPRPSRPRRASSRSFSSFC